MADKKTGYGQLSKAQQKELESSEVTVEESKLAGKVPGYGTTSEEADISDFPIFDRIARSKPLSDSERKEIADSILKTTSGSEIANNLYKTLPSNRSGKKTTLIDAGNYTTGGTQLKGNIPGTSAGNSLAADQIFDHFRSVTGKYWYSTDKNEPHFLNSELEVNNSNKHCKILIKDDASIKIDSGDFYLEKTPMRVIPSGFFNDANDKIDLTKWNIFLNGGTYNNTKFKPLFDLGREFFDHTSILSRPYTINESKVVEYGVASPIVEVNPEYHFLIESFEKMTSSNIILEYVIPNIYAMASKLVKGNEYTQGDVESQKLNTLFGLLDNLLVSVIEDGEVVIQDFDQYFDAWSENILKTDEFQKRQLARRFKYQILTQQDLEKIRREDFQRRSLLFPWVVNISFASDVTTEIAESIRIASLEKSFSRSIMKAEVASAEFQEDLGLFQNIRFNLFEENMVLKGVRTGLKTISLSNENLKVMDLQEWWDNLSSEVSSIKQPVAKVEIGDGQPSAMPISNGIQIGNTESFESEIVQESREDIRSTQSSRNEDRNNNLQNIQSNPIQSGASTISDDNVGINQANTKEIVIREFSEKKVSPSVGGLDLDDYGILFNIEPLPTIINPVANMIKKIVFAGKLNKIIKKYFRTHKSFLKGQHCYSETIMYKIMKYRVGPNGTTESVPIQTTYLMNSNDLDKIEFLDTQVKYNKDYQYDIVAYQAVIGTAYEYRNVDGATNQVLLNQDGSADIIVISRPSVKIIEIPFHTDSIRRVVDSPPIPPEAKFRPIKDSANEFYISLSDGVGERREKPIGIIPSDETAIENLMKAQRDELEEGMVLYDEDDIIKRYEVFRIIEHPKSYADFENGLYAVLDTNILLNRFRYLSNIAFKEQVNPNVKYYYMFRSVDYHDNVSNPSFIYEVENILNSGASYLRVRVVEFEEKKKEKFKRVRRFMRISPSSLQKQINLDKIDFDNLNKVSENLFLGDVNNSAWNKQFKIRLTSKSTGKKIDLNLVLRHGVKEKKFKGLGNKNKNIPNSRRGEKSVLDVINILEETKKR
jgi:hypothetical protein